MKAFFFWFVLLVVWFVAARSVLPQTWEGTAVRFAGLFVLGFMTGRNAARWRHGI